MTTAFQDMAPDGTLAQQELLFRGQLAKVAAPVLAWASLTNGYTFVTITPAGAVDSRTINAALAASTDRPTFCAALAAELNTAGTTAYNWTVNTSSPVDGLIGTAKAYGSAYNSAPTGTALVGGTGSVTTQGRDPAVNLPALATALFAGTVPAVATGQIPCGKSDGTISVLTPGADGTLFVGSAANEMGWLAQTLSQIASTYGLTVTGNNLNVPWYVNASTAFTLANGLKQSAVLSAGANSITILGTPKTGTKLEIDLINPSSGTATLSFPAIGSEGGFYWNGGSVPSIDLTTASLCHSFVLEYVPAWKGAAYGVWKVSFVGSF